MVGAWLKLIVRSAAVAAVVVAAQLGAGDALGVIGWVGPHDDRAWTTLLSWIAFAYAAAVLAGALVGRAAILRHRGGDGIAARVVASVMAGGGAAAVIGLAWLPSREVRPPVNANPGLVISLTAGGGVLAGLVLAVLALSVRAVAVGLKVTMAWVWLLAAGAAIAGLTTHEPYPAPRVALLDAPSLIPPSDWTGPRVIVVAAGVLGLVVAAVARARGASRLGAAIAGFGGPALVASAYLIAGPGEDQREAYLCALLAVAVGLATSAVVAIPTRAIGGQTRRRTTGGSTDSTVADDVLVSARVPVPSGQAAPSGPTRPAWAEGSGPVARAYTSASSHGGDSAITRGTGWDADTLHGPTHGTQSDTGGGVYRSSTYGETHEPAAAPARPAVAAVMGQPSDPHEAWLRDLGSPDRPAAG